MVIQEQREVLINQSKKRAGSGVCPLNDPSSAKSSLSWHSWEVEWNKYLQLRALSACPRFLGKDGGKPHSNADHLASSLSS